MYYVYKTCGYVVSEYAQKGFLDTFDPLTTQSTQWKHWVSQLDLKTCLTCKDNHGKIYEMNEIPEEEPPVHPNCCCEIKEMQAVEAGQGTKDGRNGADWWVKNFGKLPDYYLTIKNMEDLGWRPGKSPVKYAPGKMITGGIYRNDNSHLPDAIGRIWYEADLNYYDGRRNGHRLLWSNDGLIFVTYDHYETFYEIV